MKKILQLLSITTLFLAPTSLVACGKGGPEKVSVQLDSMVRSTSLLTKLTLLGKHENLNVNPNTLITNLYSPKVFNNGVPAVYTSSRGEVNLTADINYFANNLNSFPLMMNHYINKATAFNKAVAYSSYWIATNDDRYYQEYVDTGEFSSEPFAEREKLIGSHPQAIYNGLDLNRKELLGYVADMGSMSAYLRNNNYLYGKNLDQFSSDITSVSSRSLIKYGKFANGISKVGDPGYWQLTNFEGNPLAFGETEEKILSTELKNTMVSSWFNSFAGVFGQIEPSESGALIGSEILDNLLYLTQDVANPEALINAELYASHPFNLLEKKILVLFLDYLENDLVNDYPSFYNENPDLKETIAKALSSYNYLIPKIVGVPKIELAKNSFSDFDGSLVATADLINLIYDKLTKLNDSTTTLNNAIIDKVGQQLNDWIDQLKQIGLPQRLEGQLRTLWSSLLSAEDPANNYKFNIIDIVLGWAKLLKALEPIQAQLTAWSEKQGANYSPTNLGFKSFSIAEKEQFSRILGWEGNSFTKGSPLDVLYKAINDSTQPEYDDLNYLLLDTVNSPLLTSTSTAMKNIDDAFLQYAIDENKFKVIGTPIFDGKSDIQTLSYSLEYTGIGDASVKNLITTSQIDKIKLNDQNQYFDEYYNPLNPYSETDNQQLINYAGTEMNANLKPVDHKYDVTWSNLGSDIKPMWVITNLDSFVKSGEVLDGVGSTTTGDWTQIYFMY